MPWRVLRTSKRSQLSACDLSTGLLYRSALSSGFAAVPYTAMHPVRQLGNTLLAPSGTNTWLFLALAATEWAVLAAWVRGPVVTAGTLKVGTSWLRTWSFASITPRTAAPWAVRGAAITSVGRSGLAEDAV